MFVIQLTVNSQTFNGRKGRCAIKTTRKPGTAGCVQVLKTLFGIYRFNTEEEALAIANASNVGLAGEYVPLSSCSPKLWMLNGRIYRLCMLIDSDIS